MIIKVRDAIEEKSSYNIAFDVYHDDGEEAELSSYRVFIFVPDSGDPPIYVNNRDGSNTSGLTVTDNHVALHLSPIDNAIIRPAVLVNGHERHTVRFELRYNADDDVFYVDFELGIRNLQIVV